MSKEDIAEVIGTLTDVLETMNIEMNELQTETKDRFESIENHMINLVEDYEELKEWSTRSNAKNERELIEKENYEMKKKIVELESTLKEKEQIIKSIVESFANQHQIMNKNNWYTEKKKTKPLLHQQQENIISNNRFDALYSNDISYEHVSKAGRPLA